MIYELTQTGYQMQAEIYPDLSGRGDIKQRRVKPYEYETSLSMQAPTGRHNSILNRRSTCISLPNFMPPLMPFHMLRLLCILT